MRHGFCTNLFCRLLELIVLIVLLQASLYVVERCCRCARHRRGGEGQHAPGRAEVSFDKRGITECLLMLEGRCKFGLALCEDGVSV